MDADPLDGDRGISACDALRQGSQPCRLGGQLGRQQLRLVAEAPVPTIHGRLTALVFDVGPGTAEHLALLRGQPGPRPLLTRIHSECLTGDTMGSLRCDCGEQLASALNMIANEDAGLLVYLRGHEGRGIGLAQKIRAYALQDQGLDTVQANLALGLPADARDYTPAIRLLRFLGVPAVRLLTNNPDKARALAAHGIECVELVAMPATITP